MLSGANFNIGLLFTDLTKLSFRHIYISLGLFSLINAILCGDSIALHDPNDAPSKYSNQASREEHRTPSAPEPQSLLQIQEADSTSITVEDFTSRKMTNHRIGSLAAGFDYATNYFSGSTTPAVMIVRNDSGNIMDDGLCRLTNTSRHNFWFQVEVSELGLTCSNVDSFNYRQMLGYAYKKGKLSIQQLEIRNSEPLVVFSAIDLICTRFDCSNLTVLNVSGQKIHDHNVLGSWLRTHSRIEILDLSNTSLSSIESILQVESRPLIILPNLISLSLDHNYITRLNFTFILEMMPNLEQLSLVNNTIFDIHCDKSLIPRLGTQLTSIGLANNSINCDKDQLWLMKQFLNPSYNFKFPEYDQIRCGAPERLADMTWNQRVSVLETSICDGCDCKSIKKTAISVDCHNKNLTALPDFLPINTKILNLTSNRISSIGVPHNSKNWENVTYVYLENNLITSFQPLEINSKFMRNLAALDIRKNKFQEFPSHIFEQFINLDQVHLSNNPWLCDCEPTFAFQEWLQRQFQKVGDKEEIRCGISGSDENGVSSSRIQQRLSARVIYKLSKSELCPQENSEEPYDWLDVLNVTLSLTIIFMLLKVAVDYIYQHRTKRLPHFFRLNY